MAINFVTKYLQKLDFHAKAFFEQFLQFDLKFSLEYKIINGLFGFYG